MKEKSSAPEFCQKRGAVPAELYIQIEEQLNAQWAAAQRETSKRDCRPGKQASCYEGDSS